MHPSRFPRVCDHCIILELATDSARSDNEGGVERKHHRLRSEPRVCHLTSLMVLRDADVVAKSSIKIWRCAEAIGQRCWPTCWC